MTPYLKDQLGCEGAANNTPEGLPPHTTMPELSYLGDDASYGYDLQDLHLYAEAYAREALRAQAASVEPVTCLKCGHVNHIQEGKAPCQVSQHPTPSPAQAVDAPCKRCTEAVPIQGEDGRTHFVFGTDAAIAALQSSRRPQAQQGGGERCPLCGYQHGHAIGCANNPVDIALANKVQRGSDAAILEWLLPNIHPANFGLDYDKEHYEEDVVGAWKKAILNEIAALATKEQRS